MIMSLSKFTAPLKIKDIHLSLPFCCSAKIPLYPIIMLHWLTLSIIICDWPDVNCLLEPLNFKAAASFEIVSQLLNDVCVIEKKLSCCIVNKLMLHNGVMITRALKHQKTTYLKAWDWRSTVFWAICALPFKWQLMMSLAKSLLLSADKHRPNLMLSNYRWPWTSKIADAKLNSCLPCKFGRLAATIPVQAYTTPYLQ